MLTANDEDSAAKALLNLHQYGNAAYKRNWVSLTQNMLWKWSVPPECGIPTQTWHATGKGSRPFWWPSQPFFLQRWAAATGLCSKLSVQVTLDNFHSLQENWTAAWFSCEFPWCLASCQSYVLWQSPLHLHIVHIHVLIMVIIVEYYLILAAVFWKIK